MLTLHMALERVGVVGCGGLGTLPIWPSVGKPLSLLGRDVLVWPFKRVVETITPVSNQSITYAL